MGVALIGLWNRPGALGAVYGTDAMFILAYLARFVPVAALILAAAVRYVPMSHEEAAAAAGAGWFHTCRRIVLPQLRLGLAAAWIVVFVLVVWRAWRQRPDCSAWRIHVAHPHLHAHRERAASAGRPSRPPAERSSSSYRWRFWGPLHRFASPLLSGGSLTSAALSVRGISKRFGSHQALDGVSLEVPPSACVVILGPSGCGKTTLLRVIAGLETPDSGEIWMGGAHATAGATVTSGRHTKDESASCFRIWPSGRISPSGRIWGSSWRRGASRRRIVHRESRKHCEWSASRR